jgi:hypothetical protein
LLLVLSGVIDGLRLLLRPEWTRDRGPGGIRSGKVAADNSEPVAVFLIGFRVNRWRSVRRWLPLLLTLPTMVRALTAAPDSGLLGYRLLIGPGPRQAMMVQYWSGPVDLHRFATAATGAHRKAQQRFYWHYGAGDAVGVWHELLASPQGGYHAVYGNMPPTGIGALHAVRERPWKAAGGF